MTSMGRETEALRDLVKRYREVAHGDDQDRKRELWIAHNSLEETRVPILVSFGMHNAWCRTSFSDAQLECRTPVLRETERQLRMRLFHATIGDDMVFEPWLNLPATLVTPPGGPWGLPEGRTEPSHEEGAWRFDPPITSWDETAKMVRPHHCVDEEATRRRREVLVDAVGDLIEIDVDRTPYYTGFFGDISNRLAKLRGLGRLMEDLYESPAQLHELLAFMRDGILGVHEEAERMGDWRRTSHSNQAMCYCRELVPPAANSPPCRRKDLWYFCAAQEFALVSPDMHREFLLEYQLPILMNFGLVAYGCCENLTRKIDLLRSIPSLRRIAVSPTADVARCAEQIRRDYVMSWRPNPTDMVCSGFDEQRIRSILRAGLAASRGCCIDITLKDVETVEGQPLRLARWVQIARTVCEDA
jgi:hypothetical protein